MAVSRVQLINAPFGSRKRRGGIPAQWGVGPERPLDAQLREAQPVELMPGEELAGIALALRRDVRMADDIAARDRVAVLELCHERDQRRHLLVGDDAAGAPEHQRVELHLEQGLALERLRRAAEAFARDGAAIKDEGVLTVTAVSDGHLDGSMAVLQNIAPEDAAGMLRDAFRPVPRRTAVNTFLVHAGGRLALVDTGCGNAMLFGIY